MIFQRKNTVVKPGFQRQIVRCAAEKRHCGMRVRVGERRYQQISAAVFHRVGFKGFFLADVNYRAAVYMYFALRYIGEGIFEYFCVFQTYFHNFFAKSPIYARIAAFSSALRRANSTLACT